MAIPGLDSRRDGFLETLKVDVRSLIRLYEKDEATVGRPGEWLRAIKRSAIVLIAANLENFIEEIVCDGLTILADNSVRARNYPENFRLWRFKKSAHMRNLGLENSKELIDLSLKLYSDVRELRKDELMLKEIRDSFANPTKENVNWIMGLIGQENYVDSITLKVNGTETRAESALEELATRRNQVAHGNANQNPGIDDVKRLMKCAQAFSTRIKRDVTTSVESCMKE